MWRAHWLLIKKADSAVLIFEWDPEKARENEEKHGVSFLDASEVFDDDHSSTVLDPDHSVDEDRYLIFGLSKQGRHLVVSYTERGDRIRLISARQMTSRERRAYEQ
jgi:uncharacterized DUF497 family protein